MVCDYGPDYGPVSRIFQGRGSINPRCEMVLWPGLNIRTLIVIVNLNFYFKRPSYKSSNRKTNM